MNSSPHDVRERREAMPPLHAPALYLGDIHADALAFEKSLEEAEWIDRRYSSTFKIRKDKMDGTIVILGDIIDRWRQHLKVFEGIFQLQDQLGERMVVLTGNHEPMMIHALRNQRVPDIHHWIKKSGGSQLLAELDEAMNSDVPESSLVKDALRNGDSVSDAAKNYFLARMPNEETMRRSIDAFIAARQLFLRGRYARLFENMRVTHAAGGVLAVHAGINAHTGTLMEWNGMDIANVRYKETWDMNRLDVWESDEGLGGILWRREGINNADHGSKEALDAQTGRMLKSRGFHVLIHGHDVVPEGKQKWKMTHGVLEICNDVGMSRGISSPANSGSTAVERDGEIVVRSDVFGKRAIGRVAKDGVKTYVVA